MSALMNLSDTELLQRVWIERNPLTTTELETQLATRFEALIDENAANAAAVAVLLDHGIETDKTKSIEDLSAALKLFDDVPKNAKDFFDALFDFDIDEVEVLRERLSRLRTLDDAINDLAEPLKTLTTLATTE